MTEGWNLNGNIVDLRKRMILKDGKCSEKVKLGGDVYEIIRGNQINQASLPQDINEVIDDVIECCDDFKECGKKCFKYCGKRKIMSMSNMANMLVNPKTVQKLKQFNPRKYQSSQKKLRSYMKLISKLGNPKVTIHEKRKTLQKAQVGEGLLNIAETLIIPILQRLYIYIVI